jgi:hypothetical protein
MSTTSYVAKTFQQNTVPGATYSLENMQHKAAAVNDVDSTRDYVSRWANIRVSLASVYPSHLPTLAGSGT